MNAPFPVPFPRPYKGKPVYKCQVCSRTSLGPYAVEHIRVWRMFKAAGTADLSRWPDRARRIVVEIAQERHLPVALIVGQCRRAPVAEARHMAMTRVWKEIGLGASWTARLFGKHHTVVLHAVKKIESRQVAA